MTEAQKGNAYILAEMILWSLFPVLSILGLKGLPILVSLFWVNIFASILFFVLIAYKNTWHELKNKNIWYNTLGVVLFICVCFYGLYFYSLGKSTPANISIVALFEIVPTYIFFHIIRKEEFKKSHILGILLAVIGVLIVLLPTTSGVHSGDFIMLCAVFFPPLGNWFQQKARAIGSSETILFLRHALTIPVLAVIIFLSGEKIGISGVISVLPWLVINGVLVFGLSKVYWVEAIHRMSVTRALAISSVGPVFTVLFAWAILGQVPTLTQILAVPFLVASVLILTNFSFNKSGNNQNL